MSVADTTSQCRHVMTATRRYLIGAARKFQPGRGVRPARALIHYRVLLQQYLDAKRQVIAGGAA